MTNPGSVRRLQGVVIVGADLKPQSGVLVEVYDHPEVIAKDEEGEAKRVGRRRIAACVTDSTGEFEFQVADGRYELRCSKPVEWNCTSVIVQVRKGGGKKRIRVPLEIAN